MMMDYEAVRKRLDELAADRVVHVKLAAIYETMTALENGDIGHALIVLRRMAAINERQELRVLRAEVYRRLQHARLTGDTATCKELQAQLQKIDAAKSTLIA